MRMLTTAIAAMLFGGAALADQCAWLDKPQTAQLQKLIAGKFSGARGFVQYCERCGDKIATGIPFTAGKSVTLKQEDADHASFAYDDQTLDAAYLWLPIETGEPPFKGAMSLAEMVGCPHDTPNRVDVDKDGKVTPAT